VTLHSGREPRACYYSGGWKANGRSDGIGSGGGRPGGTGKIRARGLGPWKGGKAFAARKARRAARPDTRTRGSEKECREADEDGVAVGRDGTNGCGLGPGGSIRADEVVGEASGHPGRATIVEDERGDGITEGGAGPNREDCSGIGGWGGPEGEAGDDTGSVMLCAESLNEEVGTGGRDGGACGWFGVEELDVSAPGG
jgi:hypothetical protein